MAKRSKLSQSDLDFARKARTAQRPWEGSNGSTSSTPHMKAPTGNFGKKPSLVPMPVKIAAGAGAIYGARHIAKMDKGKRKDLMHGTVKKLGKVRGY